MTNAKTNAQRQKEWRERQRAEGLREVSGAWAYPEDHPAIKAKAASLTKARQKRIGTAAVEAAIRKAKEPK